MTVTTSAPNATTGVFQDISTFDSQTFDLAEYLTNVPEDLVASSEGRRVLTELDPLLFALVYLPHHLRSDSTSGDITFSEFHLDLCKQAQSWVKPLRGMREFRDAYIAPREVGKSTWLFTILPMWAAAHGHMQFVAAFADSASQAEQHLATFRRELDTNPLLMADFPSLCLPATRTRVAKQLADNRGQIHQHNGFIFMARGIDSATLGLKVGALRPQLIILDDVEPGQANYSTYQMEKRLATIQDVILPLNNFARVVLVGTVTMPESIIHQLVQSVTTTEKAAQWISDERFLAHYYPAILTEDDGSERSLWPAKWPMDVLDEMRHTRSFAKNFMNLPLSDDGDFWTPDDIRIVQVGETGFGNTLLSIDPAVTSKVTSDFTGLSVVSRDLADKTKTWVRYANHVRLAPRPFREKVMELLTQFPDIGLVLVETNQGGDTWFEILHDLPVKIRTVHNKESKVVRAQRVLNFYQRGQVAHTASFPVAEQEMLAFPNAMHDDVVDAVVNGINYFMEGVTAKKPGLQAVTHRYAS